MKKQRLPEQMNDTSYPKRGRKDNVSAQSSKVNRGIGQDEESVIDHRPKGMGQDSPGERE